MPPHRPSVPDRCAERQHADAHTSDDLPPVLCRSDRHQPGQKYVSLAGSNFSPSGVAPTVTVAERPVTVYSFTNTQAVVEALASLAASTYLVSVTNGVPHSGSAYVTVGTVDVQGPIGPTESGRHGYVAV
jgi:hypothetical protein